MEKAAPSADDEADAAGRWNPGAVATRGRLVQRADVLACLRDAPPRWGADVPAWAHRHADVAWHDHLDARVRWYREAARTAWDAA